MLSEACTRFRTADRWTFATAAEALEKSPRIVPSGASLGIVGPQILLVHGWSGRGNGPTAEVATKATLNVSDLHTKLVREREAGHLFNTITNGLGNMASYAAQIPVADRWAIVAYIRALQRSQNAKIEDVPEDLRDQLR